MTRNAAVFSGLAVLFSALIIGVVVYRRGPAAFPKDFPYTWLPAGTVTNDPAQVQVVRSGSPLQTFDAQVEVLHPAYLCTVTDCPGRDAAGRPLLFPYDLMGDDIKVFRTCPACRKAQRTPVANRQDGTPTIHAYLTPEGGQIMQRFVPGR